jgi:tetratricopeptide (TPR) repeat protein
MRWRFILLLAVTYSLSAEQGILLVHVKDIQKRAIPSLQLRVEGAEVSAPTDVSGIARLPLSPQTKPGVRIGLHLVEPPRELVFISPWDEQVVVPPFDSAKEVLVVLANRGDHALLEEESALRSLTANVLKATKLFPKDEPGIDEHRRREALAEVSAAYGLRPEELDKAIPVWGGKTDDPYGRGLAALYQRRYQEATLQFQKAVAKGEVELADATFYLGKSLYGEKRYRESATAYETAAKWRTDDAIILNNWGTSLFDAGDYAGAEPLFRRALAIRERTLPQDHGDTAGSLSTLAWLVQNRGDYTAAEALYRRGLAMAERALGPEDPGTALALNNLAGMLRLKGDYAGAEPLCRRALAINEEAFGPVHPYTALMLHNLAGVLQSKGDNAGAEPLYRRALAIRETVLGPEHPDTVLTLNNLAGVLRSKGDYAGAEPLQRRVLAVAEKVLGPDHPFTALSLNNIAELLASRGDYAGAEPLYAARWPLKRRPWVKATRLRQRP